MGHPKREVKSIGIALYQGSTALDVIGPYESLRSLDGVTVYFVGAQEGQAYTADSGMLTLVATRSYQTLPQPDVVLVPGSIVAIQASKSNAWEDPESEWPAIIQWVRQAYKTSVYTTSVCTGALILAAAGLLKRANVTTDWSARDEIQRPQYGATYIPQ